MCWSPPAVTVDVLLKKSDVRGALGWIAAAWFSPILGGLLYYLFGINRVTRRALKMSRLSDAQASPPAAAGLPDAAGAIFANCCEVSARVTGGPLTAGNALTVLEGGDAAYPQMLAAIAGARTFRGHGLLYLPQRRGGHRLSPTP